MFPSTGSSMILVFDLDDTLYPEITFVHGGLRAVAAWGEAEFGWDAERSCATMMSVLERDGRGAIFDAWLAGHGACTPGRIRECVRVYRYHEPRIELSEAAEAVLDRYRDLRLYLVTDGHKGVQARKVDALGLWERFERVYITHRYGRRHAKPSTHCFDLIRKREKAPWDRLMYVADDPTKDFVGLNGKGAHTVRVLTGRQRDVTARPGYEAQARIGDLTGLPAVVDRVFGAG